MATTAKKAFRPEILSEVAKELPRLEWYNKAFMIPHEPIRHDMQKMLKAITASNLPQSQSWKIRFFMDWYKQWFYVFVHHHHDIEEKIFFPWIQTRCELPKKVSDDHKELMRMLDAVLDFGQQLEKVAEDADAWNSTVKKLEEAVKQLVEHMNAHLDEEERVVVDKMVEKFTEEEHDKVTAEKILKPMPLAQVRQTLPHILHAISHWGGPEEEKKFLANLPLPLRLWTLKRWVPQYRRGSLAVLDSLLLDQEEPPASVVKRRGLCACFSSGGSRAKTANNKI